MLKRSLILSALTTVSFSGWLMGGTQNQSLSKEHSASASSTTHEASTASANPASEVASNIDIAPTPPTTASNTQSPYPPIDKPQAASNPTNTNPAIAPSATSIGQNTDKTKQGYTIKLTGKADISASGDSLFFDTDKGTKQVYMYGLDKTSSQALSQAIKQKSCVTIIEGVNPDEMAMGAVIHPAQCP